MSALASLVKAVLLGAALLFLTMYATGAALSWTGNGARGLSSFVIDHSGWPTATGFVIMQNRDLDGVVSVTFIYGVAGRPYSGTQSWTGEGPAYSRGDSVTVYYDTNKPSISVVDPSRRQAPMPELLTQPALAVLSFGAYCATVIWAWASCCAWLAYENGRRTPMWSWRPRRNRIWRIAGAGIPPLASVVLLGRMAFAGDLSSGIAVLSAVVAMYLVIPFALAGLLRRDNFVSGWMASLGGSR
jgi:hypothetical protein